MKKRKEKELEQDLFSISKANRRVMVGFLIIMLALWCIPIYSLLKDSLKVHGIENYFISMDKHKLDFNSILLIRSLMQSARLHYWY